ncbi:MAG: hypothetical protein JNK25_04245 [Phycisphaerae bacterium]|nr:hypothetical protein [Phycisphaerae bacterium]
MTLAATALLGALGALGRSRAAAPTQPAPGTGGDFSEALARAESGHLSSGAPVRIAKGLDLKLSESQLSRLAGVADRAEAQGAHRAIVLLDGQALTLDVNTRTITGRADLSATRIHTDADAVITVAPEAEANTVLGPPAGINLASPSLLQALSTPRDSVKPAAD